MKKPAPKPLAPPPDWPRLRARYEAGEDYVYAIAEQAGITQAALSKMARDEGWQRKRITRRKPAIGETGPTPPQTEPEARPITSTKEAINRLKLLVQQRITRLESKLAEQGADSERGISAANLLARTLEKVLELEEQQRRLSRLTTHEGKRRDDAWREELAGRLARLGRPGADAGTSDAFGDAGAVA
jgi:hypothetical protein